MPSINQQIIISLLHSKQNLSNNANTLILSFIQSQMHIDGGFIDRSKKIDPYYCVFGYTLSYVFNNTLDVKKEKISLMNWQSNQVEISFIDAISLIRCYFLLELIQLVQKFPKLSPILIKSNQVAGFITFQVARKVRKKHKDLLLKITEYKAKNGGFNHLAKDADKPGVYANFLVTGLFQDLHFSKKQIIEVAQSSNQLKLNNGAFVNHTNSKHGICSTSAAGLLQLLLLKKDTTATAGWLKSLITPSGGFLAGEKVPVADVLSTSTALLALNLTHNINPEIINNAIGFVNLHWDETGGFFGSIADQIPDVEYTFYGLLTIGQLMKN